MSKVTIDGATLAVLQGGQKVLELCDNSGQVIGHFLPLDVQHDTSGLEPCINEEELDRRERAGGGRSLAAILADLEQRP